MPAVSALIATIAACVSAWSAARSAKNADRQYVAGYASEVTSWAMDVSQLMISMDDMLERQERDIDFLNQGIEINRKLVFMILKGSIIFPNTDVASFSTLGKATEEWNKDFKLIGTKRASDIEAEKYQKLLFEFIEQVKIAVGTDRRHRDVNRYLS